MCIYGHGWQEGEITVTSPYVYRSSLPFEGRVAVNVALHGTNITLEGSVTFVDGLLLSELFLYFMIEIVIFSDKTELFPKLKCI